MPVRPFPYNIKYIFAPEHAEKRENIFEAIFQHFRALTNNRQCENRIHRLRHRMADSFDNGMALRKQI